MVLVHTCLIRYIVPFPKHSSLQADAIECRIGFVSKKTSIKNGDRNTVTCKPKVMKIFSFMNMNLIERISILDVIDPVGTRRSVDPRKNLRSEVIFLIQFFRNNFLRWLCHRCYRLYRLYKWKSVDGINGISVCCYNQHLVQPL